MSIQPVKRESEKSFYQFCQIDSDHSEQLTRTLSSITLNPLKNGFFYFFPFLQVWTTQCTLIKERDITHESIMEPQAKKEILRELNLLKAAAKIDREVVPYTALRHNFLSCGGSLSLTSPAIILPYQHLFRPNSIPFTQENKHISIKTDDIWRFSDHEVRFLIARELSHIKQNDALLRMITKIAIVAALGFLCLGSLSFGGGILFFAVTITVHLLLERQCQAEMDIAGVEILARRLGNHKVATAVAISALEKMRKKNLARDHFYITKTGDNIFDLNNPRLTARIEAVKKKESLYDSTNAGRHKLS